MSNLLIKQNLKNQFKLSENIVLIKSEYLSPVNRKNSGIQSEEQCEEKLNNLEQIISKNHFDLARVRRSYYWSLQLKEPDTELATVFDKICNIKREITYFLLNQYIKKLNDEHKNAFVEFIDFFNFKSCGYCCL